MRWEKRAGEQIVARAPVRISFGGGGTDLAAYYERFGGFVVSSAISRHCYVLVRPAKDKRVTLTSLDYGLTERIVPDEVPSLDRALALVKAGIVSFAQEGFLESGTEVFTASDVPPGTGLGSSSALAVALMLALSAFSGIAMTRREAAEAACRLEIETLGMPIGKQDQYAAAFGGLNALTFTRGHTIVEAIGLTPAVIEHLSRSLLLFSTGHTRNSSSILVDQRRDTADKQQVVESLHHLKALACGMHLALTAGKLDEFGRLLDEAWQHKKRLNSGISSDEIDGWYKRARQSGALGGKITGAGGGGYLLLYCPQGRQAAVRSALVAEGLEEMSFDLERCGVTLMDPDAVPARLRDLSVDDGIRASSVVPSPIRRQSRETGRRAALDSSALRRAG